jgi:hypothetical protein
MSEAIHDTFQRRKTHDIPATLTVPPTSWSVPFAELAQECGMNTEINLQFNVIKRFVGRLHL